MAERADPVTPAAHELAVAAGAAAHGGDAAKGSVRLRGRADLPAVRPGGAVRRPARAPSIRWRSCSPRRASSRPMSRPAPSSRWARPISAATSMPSSSTARAARSRSACRPPSSSPRWARSSACVAGYFGGTTDAVLMRIADMALSLPFLPFVIVLTGFLGASTSNIVLAVAVLLWPNSARVIRSQVLTLRERAYVEAARVTGASAWRILFVHIAPNILPLSFVYAAIAIGWAIITEASVSFLGFGDSTSVSWGMMLQDAFTSQALSRGQYAWFVPPGICIILVVVAGFFISRGYEEVFMPRLRGDDDDPRGRQPADPLQHARRRGARRRRRLLRRARGPHRRPGGRIGLRQDHGGARHHGRAGRERPAGRRPHRLQGPGHGRGHDPPAALARHRLRAAKRHELARPGLHGGLAARSKC